MPKDTNAHGMVFGGTILAWIDMTAAMAAEKHSSSQVVTASIDSVSFHTPINIDDHVVLKAQITYVHHSSMEVAVKVIRDNPHTNTETLATEAFVTFVALDGDKKPMQVPALDLETEQEKLYFQQGKNRRAYRLRNRNIEK